MTLERSSSKLKVLVSMPSITIFPEEASIILRRPSIIELLPLPVRPTIPIFSPASIVKLRFLSTSLSYGLYLNE